MVGKTEHQ